MKYYLSQLKILGKLSHLETEEVSLSFPRGGYWNQEKFAETTTDMVRYFSGTYDFLSLSMQTP